MVEAKQIVKKDLYWILITYMDYHTLDLNLSQMKKNSFHSHQKGSVKEAGIVQCAHPTPRCNFLYN